MTLSETGQQRVNQWESHLQERDGSDEEVREGRDDEADGHDWQAPDVVTQQPA